MSVVYNATLKTNRMQLVADLIASKVAAASTGSATAGKLVIGDGTLAGPGATGVLCTVTLPATAFTVSGAVATLQGVPLSGTASATGTASKAELRNNADAVVVSGLTVGVGSGDIQLTSTAITNLQTVTVNSGTLTHG
jgi:hypothetical protein